MLEIVMAPIAMAIGLLQMAVMFLNGQMAVVPLL